MLYFRQILVLPVSLFTVRIVFNALGNEDYGIYNVIGGIVSLFSFLGVTMASATQRFFSFALGQQDEERLKKIFSVNWLIYMVIALIAFLLLETAGLWFVNEHLHVPQERFEAARRLYHFSVASFMATIFTTPFMAMIIAHEDMQIYAYVSIIEVAMKLGVAFLLIRLPGDKLEVYGFLIFMVAIINTIIYASVCQFKKFYCDKGMLREIFGFTGWTLYGQITAVARNQAVTILLNQIFNPVVVAARAIATSVSGYAGMLASNFNTSLYPPIIKAYAAKDEENMFRLIFNGSKMTFFLMWVVTLPVLLEMDTILQVWLKNPPHEAVLFTRLALIEVLINSLSLPIMTAARAPGKMKRYELTLGSIQCAVFFVSWPVLKMGGAAYSVFIVAIGANVVMFAVRLMMMRKLIGCKHPINSPF